MKNILNFIGFRIDIFDKKISKKEHNFKFLINRLILIQ